MRKRHVIKAGGLRRENLMSDTRNRSSLNYEFNEFTALLTSGAYSPRTIDGQFLTVEWSEMNLFKIAESATNQNCILVVRRGFLRFGLHHNLAVVAESSPGIMR